MRFWLWISSILLGASLCGAAEFTPAPQAFGQEVSSRFENTAEVLPGDGQLIEMGPDGAVTVMVAGQWHVFRSGAWDTLGAAAPGTNRFSLPETPGSANTLSLEIPWPDVRQVVRGPAATWILTREAVYQWRAEKLEELPWPSHRRINSAALSPQGELYLACSSGLFQRVGEQWRMSIVTDATGRDWVAGEVLTVLFDPAGRLWLGTRAGAACGSGDRWQFWEGRDGLPWNEFTCAAAGPKGETWFGTSRGAMRFDGKEWHYRQGRRWLSHDEVRGIVTQPSGRVWLATKGGTGWIERRPMTLSAKAEFYELEIELHIKRTPFGYVAEAPLKKAAERYTAAPEDSDNDGLWTAMYGAGECFSYGATRDSKALERAQKAFEALRFLQKVTQGGKPAPPPGYVARTIRPIDLPDPNIGRLAADKEAAKRDKLWKVYEPRWPKSADGQWFWKSDTSSDELDGHYFFYPLYYDLCAQTDAEKARVREVVRDLTDHLLNHRFVLMDHDGRPTRWAIYNPEALNGDSYWWAERGLKSLSILCYLAVASHITGDPKYEAASRELIDQHGYAANAMFAKLQHGPGSGNQSDDEMAVMCYYGLLRWSKDEKLKQMIRYSFYRYWAVEAPEMNPFFNFAYAALNLGQGASNPWASFSLSPWPGWHEDSMATLRGFPLDRLNWAHQNSHRLDIVPLTRLQAVDLDDPEPKGSRGHRPNGKVIPVENRHFNHWNTDPWRLDYGGEGNELAAGTVYLLPYYMGLYHGFILRPGEVR